MKRVFHYEPSVFGILLLKKYLKNCLNFPAIEKTIYKEVKKNCLFNFYNLKKFFQYNRYDRDLQIKILTHEIQANLITFQKRPTPDDKLLIPYKYSFYSNQTVHDCISCL